MSSRIDLMIIEYRDGKAMHLYDGVSECAEAYHCHVELIKALLYTGNPFPYLTENITFDISPLCKMHIERRDPDARRTRYYSFDIVPDASDSKTNHKGERSLT